MNTLTLSNSRWAATLRIGTLAFAILVIGLIVTAVPLRYQMLLNDAYGIGPALAEIGVSLRLFALYFVFWELLFATGSLIVGIIIALRKRDDWFALLVAFSLILSGSLVPLVDGLIRANSVWQLPIVFLRWLCLTSLVAVLCLFPNGRFVPYWLRYILIGWMVYTVTLLLYFPDVMANTAVIFNTGTLEDFLRLFSGTVWFAPPVAAQIYRYQRVSTPIERQQTKWVLVGFTVIVCFSCITAIFLTTNPALPHEPDAPVVAVLVLGTGYLLTAMLLPLSIAFAIFRYRLWQIDIILNRALVYGGLSVLITAVYILLVGGFGVLTVNQQGQWMGWVVATAISLVLLRPLHTRLQTFVDRLIPLHPANQSTHHPFQPISWFRLGMAAAWLAIFLLWTSWLAGALLYVRLIFTDLDVIYNWHDVLTGEAIRAASAGLGISPAIYAWMVFGMELALVMTFGVAGVILFWHKRDWFGAFLGVSLVLIATRISGPVTFTLYSEWPMLERPFNFLSGLAFVAFGALLYLFPDGRFVPTWTRWLLPLIALQMLWAVTGMPEQLGTVFALIYLGIGLGAQAYRYRQLSDAVARRHVRWIIASFAAFVGVIVVGHLMAPNALMPTRPPSPQDLLVMLIIGPAITAVSISFIIALSVAILRDGLYNLDIFINRALVYGGLTLLITAVYILLVGGVGLLAGQGSVMVGLLVATVLVGVGVRPLHTRWQTQIDNWLPPPLPTNHPETQEKVSQPVWLRTVWGIFILLTLVLFAAGLAHQAQSGFWQQPTAELLAVAPLLANPFGTDFFLKNDLYAFVLAGGYLHAVVFVMVGLFLFWRKSGDVMGVLASWMLIAIGLGFTATIVFLPVLQPAWHLPTSLFQAALFGSVFLFLCLFPNGRFYPHWTRTAAIIWLVYVLLWLPFPHLNLHRAIAIWPAVVFGAVVWLGVVAQLLRYRRISNADEKQQTKWVIAGFVVANFGLVGIAFLLSLETIYPPALLTGAVLALAIMPIFIPLSIGVALLRYRLWQIDIILNRSLVYGGLTAVILAIYIIIVGGLSLLFQSQNNLLISLLATGLIAVFFQPVRDRLQRGVNHLLYGDRDEPYKVLSQLGRQLRETAVPGETLPAITATICQTLKLPYAAVALHTAEGERRTAAAIGQPTTIVEEWPLLHQGELVGWLIVAPRTPQERFTEKERQLLADIAGQAGAAAYAERLTAALQRSRERLVLAREEERRRIRRDLHDELGPSLASQTFALDTALELLETDPQAAVPLLTSLKSQNQSLIADIRRLVYALRPPSLDELGLLAALQIHLSQITPGNNGLQVKVTAVPDPLPPLPAAVEVAAYRIALEGITNVVRHARARQANIWLAVAPASLSLTITDDGVGLPPELRPGVGLASMRERAEELGGTFYVDSSPGGTSITAIVPLMEIKVALPAQLPLVMDILGEAAAWLAAKGVDQWPSPPNEHWWRRMERQLANGELYLAYLSGEAVGTLRLIWSDPYWPDDETAGYVHSLAIRNRAHGLKMGATLLNWAMDESRRQGKKMIRLDCGARNGRMRRYYEELGFVYCGEVQDHDYTAVLYEKKL